MAALITKVLIALSNLGTWILEDIWHVFLFLGITALLGIVIRILSNPFH